MNKSGFNCNKKRLSQIKTKLEDFHFFSSLDAVSFPWNACNVNQNFNNHKSWTLVGLFNCVLKKKKVKNTVSADLSFHEVISF